MMSILSIKSQQTLILPAPPSCIELSSIDSSAVIVGTYSLDSTDESTTSASRSGSLCVLIPTAPDSYEYKIQGRYSTKSAVLDISVNEKHNIIAVANSTGAIELWQESSTKSEPEIPILVHIRTVQALPTDILVLSLHRHPFTGIPHRKLPDGSVLHWSPNELVYRDYSNVFAVSLSDGAVAVIDCQKPDSEAVIWSAQAHSLEAWTVRWQPHTEWGEGSSWIHSCMLLSGGDDSHIRLQSVPLDVLNPANCENHPDLTAEELTNEIVAVDRRIHGAGVTAILPLEYGLPTSYDRFGSEEEYQDVVLTGSYDDRIRVMDMGLKSGRSPRWRCLAELNLGGGVWRLSMIARSNNRKRIWVLASCMYTGCRVLEVSVHSRAPENAAEEQKIEWAIRLVAKMEEHESMNYASIWVQSEKDREESNSEKDRNLEYEQLEDRPKGRTPGQREERATMSEGKSYWETNRRARQTFDQGRFISTSFYDRRFCVWKVPVPAEPESGDEAE